MSDFTDVHVTLDWVIRVHGTTDATLAEGIATEYIADQPIHNLVNVLAHEDGVLCAGDPETGLDEDGNLGEEELTVALYPEDQPLPMNVPVAVGHYFRIEEEGPTR